MTLLHIGTPSLPEHDVTGMAGLDFVLKQLNAVFASPQLKTDYSAAMAEVESFQVGAGVWGQTSSMVSVSFQCEAET